MRQTEDPWSLLKLQARCFLNSPDNIVREVIDGILLAYPCFSIIFLPPISYLSPIFSAVENSELHSDLQINSFCAKKLVQPILVEVVAKNKLDMKDIPEEAQEKVAIYNIF